MPPLYMDAGGRMRESRGMIPERSPAFQRLSETVAQLLSGLVPAQLPPLPGVPDFESLDSTQWILETGSIQ